MGIQVKTERVPTAEANQRYESQITQQGGVSFDLTERVTDRFPTDDSITEDAIGMSSDTTTNNKHVTLLLQPERIITGAEKGVSADRLSGRVAVTMTTDQRFNGASYAMNLQDAPPELQAAVDKAWDTLQVNEKALQGDLPAELTAQMVLLEPIIRARLAAVERVEKPVEPTKTSVRPEVAPEKTPEQKFKEALQAALPGIEVVVLNAANADGGFVFRTDDGMIVGAKISTEVTGPKGRETVRAWRVTLTAGSAAQEKIFALTEKLQSQGGRIEYRAKLGDMPESMRRGLNNTANLKREAGLSDDLLFQAQSLREQGKAFGRQMEERGKWVKDTPDSMPLDSGYIRWQKLPDGKWKVADTQGVRGVAKDAVYLADLSNAPTRVREEVAKSGFLVRSEPDNPKAPYVDITSYQTAAMERAAADVVAEAKAATLKESESLPILARITVGSGWIDWKQLANRSWIVAATEGVSDVVTGQIFSEDMSDAPESVQTAMWDQRGELIEARVDSRRQADETALNTTFTNDDEDNSASVAA